MLDEVDVEEVLVGPVVKSVVFVLGGTVLVEFAKGHVSNEH